MKFSKRITAGILSLAITFTLFSICPVSASALGESIKTGAYYIVNAATGNYLSITSNLDADGTNVKITTPKVDEVRQVMKIKKNTTIAGGNYIIQPAESTTRGVYITDTSPKTGSDVRIKLLSNSKNYDWYFERIAVDTDGSPIYAIKSGASSALALTAEGTATSSNVGVATYNTANTLQRWKLVPFTLKKEGDDPQIKAYGVDVSQWQGDINWQAVKEYGVDFAIIRIGYSGRDEENGGLDPKFYQNYDAATKQNIKVGTYIYSYSTTVEDARLDAKQVLDQLGGRYLDYPIFFDIEDPEYQAGLSKRLKTDMCLEFIKVIEAAGYEAGVYASADWFSEHLYYDEIKAVGATWYAKWPQSARPDEDHSKEELWQYRSDGRVAGIDGGTGNVDMNVSYYVPGSHVYTGSAIKSSFNVFSPSTGERLTEGVDYTVTYRNNVNVGTAQAIITGIGAYAGVFNYIREFEVLPRDLSSCSYTISERTYSGVAITPNPTIKFSNKTLKKDIDYTVTYKNNKNAGTATATVKGKGNFKGSLTLNFTIKKKNVKYADFEGIKDMVYTGKSRKLSGLKVKTSKTTLKKNTDYTVTYKNNKEFGKASVTIKGKGDNCKGKITKTFNIVPSTPKNFKASSTTRTKTTLKWEHVDYATRYQIYRATSKNGKYTRIHSTSDRWVYSYTDTSLKEGNYYYYKIRAYKKVDGKKYYGAWSDIITVKTKISDTTFTAQKDYDNSSVTLKIKKDKSVTGYIVYMYKSKSKSYEKVWAGKSTKYTRQVSLNKNYYFKIRTYKKTSNGKIYGKLSDKIKVRLDYPEKIKDVKASAKSKGGISLSWKEDKAATMYQIYRATSKEGKYKRVMSTKKLTKIDDTTKKGTYYYYKIRAYKKVGDKKYYGEWSEIIKKKAK